MCNISATVFKHLVYWKRIHSFCHPLSIFGGFLHVQHPPTAQTHIILTEDKSVSVKCVAYTHVDHQVHRGRRMHAGMHGQAFVHHKNT